MAKSNPKYVFKTREVFNKTYGDKSSEFRSLLRPVLSDPSFRYYLAQNLISRIQENTGAGKDKNGITISSYAPYSKSYRKSLAFKVYGKTSKVDLTLTGEMLSSIVESKRDYGDIVLQFEGDFNILKASAHINGVRSKNIPKRDFFGMKENEEQEILKQSLKDFRSANAKELIDLAQETLG